VLFEIGLAEHFEDVLVVVVPPSSVVVVVVPPPTLATTLAERLALAENVASICSTYHVTAPVKLASVSTTSPLQTMAPPPKVELQFFEQSSGVVVQFVLLVT
jgi:hypothetical protein